MCAMKKVFLGVLSSGEYFFFFSSRRRHTRLTCDWSSDVCSSDLWISFERARRLAHAGQQREAAGVWLQIASAEGLESRQLLQAWHFLRQAGFPPPADQAKLVLGVVAQMPVQGSHDLLAAYRDGSARYLNYSGKAVVWEDRSDAQIQ